MPRLAFCAALVLFVASACLAPRAYGGESPELQPGRLGFPPDVPFFLQIDGVDQIARTEEGRPLDALLARVLALPDVEAAWAGLAQRAGLDGRNLFVSLFGRTAAIGARPEGGAHAWVIMLPGDGATVLSTINRLDPQRLAPRDGFEMARLPEQRLLIAAGASAVLIADERRPSLLDEMMRLAGAEVPSAPQMLEHVRGLPDPGAWSGCPADVQATALMVIGHEEPIGGVSVVDLCLAGQQLLVRHRARFGASPFERPVSARAIDPAPLDVLGPLFLVSMVEPTDIGFGPAQAYVESVLGEALIGRELAARIGDRQIVTIGEVDERVNPGEERRDRLAPCFALAFEVRDAENAQGLLEERLQAVVASINRLGEGRYLVEYPPKPPGGIGHVDLEPAMRDVGGFPILPRLSLDWSAVSGPHGQWLVVATHPAQLHEMRLALEAPRSPSTGSGSGVLPRSLTRNVWTSCGVFNAARLRDHLDHLRSVAPQIAAAQSGAAEDLKRTLDLLSAMSSTLSRGWWSLRRPAADQMVLEWILELAPPDSAP